MNEYIQALRERRERFRNAGNHNEAERYDSYADAVEFSARHVRDGEKLTPDEAERYCRDLLHLSSPSEIQALVPFSRWNAVYKAVMELAQIMECVKAGKPARKRLGLFS